MDIKKRILFKTKVDSFTMALLASFFLLMTLNCIDITYRYIIGDKQKHLMLSFLSVTLPFLVGIIGYNSKILQRYNLRRWRKKIVDLRSGSIEWRSNFFSKGMTKDIHENLRTKKQNIDFIKSTISIYENAKRKFIKNGIWDGVRKHSNFEKELSGWKIYLKEVKSSQLTDEEVIDNVLDYWNGLRKKGALKFEKRIERYQNQINIFDEILKI